MPFSGIIRRSLRLLPISALFWLFFFLWKALGAEKISCVALAEEALRALRPRAPVELRFRAKAGADTGGLEATSGAWVVLEVPLWSRKEQREEKRMLLRHKKAILGAIARLQSARARLFLLRQEKEYRRRRAEAGFEDWERFLGLLEAEEKALATLRDAVALLEAYGIPTSAAEKCSLQSIPPPCLSEKNFWPRPRGAETEPALGWPSRTGRDGTGPGGRKPNPEVLR